MNKYEQRMRQLTDFDGHVLPQLPRTLPEVELERAERELGCSLPDDYREFLRDYGGFFVSSQVEIPNPKADGPSYGGVETFCGVNPLNPLYDIVIRYRNRDPEWPSRFLPIGFDDDGRGCMCLVLAEEERGAAYYWEGGDDRSLEPENFHFVAPSFEELMRLFEPRTEE